MPNWNRDLSTLLFAEATSSVRSLCWGLLFLGLVYFLGGLAVLFAPPPTPKGQPPVSPNVPLGALILVVSTMTIVAPFLIYAEKKVGVTMAWLSILSWFIFAVFAVIGALRTNNLMGAVPVLGIGILVVRGIGHLTSDELYRHMRCPPKK